VVAKTSRAFNADGTPALSNEELGQHLLEIAKRDDDGKPKTGRRYYYLALSHGYIQPNMSASPEGKKSRDAAYDRITRVLGVLRKADKLSWDMVLDLTRELDQWQTYESPREARAALRERYDEDRWLGQPFYPILIVEKDTMEPVCQPMAQRWQMPFASSRGYGSLKLQHDVAQLLRRRQAKTAQRIKVFFVSDLDPSGLDLQRSWEDALRDFGVAVKFVRIALTRDQVSDNVDARGNPLEDLGIEVKASDTRSEGYVEQYGDRCWEVDILPEAIIQIALTVDIENWLTQTIAATRKGNRTSTLIAIKGHYPFILCMHAQLHFQGRSKHRTSLNSGAPKRRKDECHYIGRQRRESIALIGGGGLLLAARVRRARAEQPAQVGKNRGSPNE
jgi:hypothetical protein